MGEQNSFCLQGPYMLHNCLFTLIRITVLKERCRVLKRLTELNISN